MRQRPPMHRNVRRRGTRGLVLFDVLLASTVLAIGLLGFIGSIGTAQGLGRSVEERTVALKTLESFMERLRADPNWATLYDRLRVSSVESASDTGLAFLKVDPSLATHSASAYFSGFVPPTSLGTVTFLVQVPRNVVDTVGGLRETIVAPRYGLPADLDGDGDVDGDVRDADYVALPVVVRIRWARPARASQEIVVATWLRGDRG
jgi:hypothetical protein